MSGINTRGALWTEMQLRLYAESMKQQRRWSEMTWWEHILICAARRAACGRDYRPEAYAFLLAYGPEYSQHRAHLAAFAN